MTIMLPMLLLIQSVDVSAQPMPQSAEEQPVDWAAQFGFEEEKRDPVTGELPVAPYHQDNSNAGAEPVDSTALADQFGGQEGIRTLTDRLVVISEQDPRIGAIFQATTSFDCAARCSSSFATSSTQAAIIPAATCTPPIRTWGWKSTISTRSSRTFSAPCANRIFPLPARIVYWRSWLR